MIKDVNMTELENYAELIKKGDPDFIEVKAYMWVGESQKRLEIKNMPQHEEIADFTKELIKSLHDYEIVSDHVPSRVVMCAKKKYKMEGKWKTWIDFKKFDELVNSGKEFSTEDFLLNTPQTGLSGKTTNEWYGREEHQ